MRSMAYCIVVLCSLFEHRLVGRLRNLFPRKLTRLPALFRPIE